MSSIKKKRVSKKSKLSWRKHVNINDVEEFLEEKRLEERLGPPVSALSNDELFQVDTNPTEKLLSARERRQLRALQPPKCFALLEPHTKVPDPIQKRNRVRSKEERKNILVKNKEAERRTRGILRAREKQAVEDKILYVLNKKNRPKRGEFNANIWDEEEKLGIQNNEWISNSTTKHNLAGTGKIRKTVSNRVIPKTSILPSVQLPHPGMSYNPSFEDHQSLIKEVAEKETKVIKEEEHLNRVTRDMFKKVTENKRDSSWLEEMSQGLYTENNNDAEELTDDEYKTVNPPVQNKKKSTKQRRKQKEQKQQEFLKQTRKVQKKKVSDMHQLRLLKKQIDNTEKKSDALREKRKKIKTLKEKEPKRLSLMKFEEQDMEFNMGTEITGNLRSLKKEGNLLSDRFKSLQRRNIVEPSIRRHKKKSKVKVYTKPGHKEDWIKTVARAKSLLL